VEQKISAAEKWLKIMQRSYRQRTRRQKRLSLCPAGSDNVGDLSASRKTNNKVIFYTPFF